MAYPHFKAHEILNRCFIAFFGIAALLLFLAVPQGNAQTAGTGSIQGAVTDSTGAVIPGASVTLTNTETDIKHQAVTDGSGLYSFPNIAIGTYSVDVDAAGFQHYRQVNIVLEVGSSIAVNVKVAVGGGVQQVEVQANGLALQTEDTSYKQTIDQQTVTQLPLNGRQMTSLITLSGGSVNAYTGNDLSGSKSFYSSAVISVAGGQGNATDYELDGADNNDYMTNINLPFPFPDAVAQFSVETTAMGAQGGGLHPGGVVDVVTRSGTNEFHGTGFEFIRNNYIDATNFFSTSKDQLHENQFGGTLGGPVIKNKLFAFAGYQRTIANQAQASTESFVPTAANLAGDFSVTDGAGCESSGKAVQLVDPKTGTLLTNDQGVNTAEYSPAALALLKYFPATTNPCGEVTYAIPSLTTENEFISRVDWSINQKHSFYGRYYVDGYQAPGFYSPTNIFLTSQAGNVDRVQGLTLAETFNPTPNLVNTFHATGSIRSINRGPVTPGINPATLGINMYSDSPTGIAITTSNKWATYCSKCSLAYFVVNTLSFTDDVNWVHGKHQVAFGGGFVRGQLNANNVYEGNGAFTFSGIYSKTGPAGTSVGGTGEDANLDFLEGALNNFIQSNNQQSAARMSVPSLYIQDTYHATKKLVVAAGVRWDPEFFPNDYFGRGGAFSLTGLDNNVFSTVYPNAPAGSTFYGDPGVNKAFTTNRPWQFSPRIGITYDPFANGKTVFRAGGGIVYDTPNLFTAEHQTQDPPFSEAISNTPVGVPLSFDSPWSGGSTPANPFPIKGAVFPPGNQLYALSPTFRSPYTVQWTASVQQEFGRGWQFQIDYIANQSSYQAYASVLDPATYIPGVWGAGGTGCTGIVTTGPSAVKPGAAGTPCSTTSNYASRFLLTQLNPTSGPKYQGGGGAKLSTGSFGLESGQSASYEGAVFTLQHRMSTHFVLLANYTLSHCIDVDDNNGDVGASMTAQNTFNERADRANCGFDYRHVINTTVVADSHFSSLSGWKKQLVNGWEISPLVHITDGAPFTVLSGVDNSLTDQNNDRPNLTNPSVLYTHLKIRSGPSTHAQYISAAAFT
jgi:hypothetical protein